MTYYSFGPFDEDRPNKDFLVNNNYYTTKREIIRGTIVSPEIEELVKKKMDEAMKETFAKLFGIAPPPDPESPKPRRKMSL